jgi:hypothetical protein
LISRNEMRPDENALGALTQRLACDGGKPGLDGLADHPAIGEALAHCFQSVKPQLPESFALE